MNIRYSPQGIEY